jgi:transcription initiation factor TFIIA large subunit
VASFPWEPAPEPPAPITNPPTVPSQSSQSSHALPASAPQNAATNAGETRIKVEPGYENGVPNFPSQQQQQYVNPGTQAQQRAAQLLQQQYGSQASASIGALQQQGLHLPGRGPAPQQAINRAQGDQPANQQYLREQEQARQQRSEITNAQTDGAGDSIESWQAMVAARRAEYATMREQVEQLSRQMDSGLMIPHSERRQRKGKRSTKPAASHRTLVMSQLDGVDDIKEEDEDKEIDEDAINSDLDDSEDDLGPDNEDDEDAAKGDVVLSTYDKVQRVKNKWKCTLKDGVLSTGGKDYLFHKSQGEFEW